MTTGNDTQDLRATVTLATGVNKVGTYWSRVWNGGDRPRYVDPLRVCSPSQGLYFGRFWGRPPKRARSDAAEHPYTMSLVSYYDPAGEYRSGSWYSTTFRSWVGLPLMTDPWTANDDIKLLNKLREKISGDTFNAAVTMAEGNEALHSIFAAAKTLDSVYRHAKRGDYKAASKALSGYEKAKGRPSRVLANGWLTNQYAVKPLLNDVYSAAVTLAHMSSYPIQQSYTVSRKVTGVVRFPVAFLTPSAAKGFSAKKIKAVIKEVNVPGLLGLTDPLSVAWEKLPYSFVLDWFVPVGNYLSARGLAQNITGTFVTSKTIRLETHGSPAASGGVAIRGFDAFRYREVSLTRTVSTTLNVPFPRVKPLSEMTSWSHAASATSLLLQRRK